MIQTLFIEFHLLISEFPANYLGAKNLSPVIMRLVKPCYNNMKIILLTVIGKLSNFIRHIKENYLG